MICKFLACLALLLASSLLSPSVSFGQNAQCTLLTGPNFGTVVPYTATPPPAANAPCQIGSQSGYVSETSSGIGVNSNSVCSITTSGHTLTVPYEGNPTPALNAVCQIGNVTGYISSTSAVTNANALCTLLTGPNFGAAMPYAANPAPQLSAQCKVGNETGFISRTSATGPEPNSLCTIAASGKTLVLPYQANPAPTIAAPCQVAGIGGYISQTTGPSSAVNAQCTVVVPSFVQSAPGVGNAVPYYASPAPALDAPCNVGVEAGFVSSTSLSGVSPNAVCTIVATGGVTINAAYEGNPAPALNSTCIIGGRFTGKITQTQQPGWSRGTLPFDLVYATNSSGSFTDSGLDRNGVMLNPVWYPQVSKGTNYRPDFQKTCFVESPLPNLFGPQNPNSLLGSITGLTTLESFDVSHCTTQHVSFDPWSGNDTNVNLGPINLGGIVGPVASVFGLCQGLMNGHLNWFPVTYTGALYFDDWSNSTGEDDDYNFSLVHQDKSGKPDQSGLTSEDIGAENHSPDPAFLLEFFSDETTHFWGSPFWKQVRNSVEQTPRHLAGFWAGGSPAIVTGLFGLDGVHSGYTELHPVYSMAVHLLPDSQPKPDGKGGYIVTEHWAFWIRNYGNEGNCSSMEHLWRRNGPDATDSSGRLVYYIQLPWHQDQDKTGASVPAASLVSVPHQAWMWQPGESWSVQPDSGHKWTYLEFHLANGSYAGADGEIYLPYEVGRVPANPTVASQMHPVVQNRAPVADIEINWDEVQKQVTDPEVRARLLKAITMRPTFPPANSRSVAASKGVATSESVSSNVVLQDTVKLDPIKQARAAEIKALTPK